MPTDSSTISFHDNLILCFFFSLVKFLCVNRLGEAEKAIYHYKHAGPEADHVDISKAKALQAHLNKCTEARKHRDWNTLIKETAATISAGADSAPQVSRLVIIHHILTPVC